MKIDLVVSAYIINDNKVLLINHRKLNLWLPVGGHIDENETPDQALVREAKEEVGLDIKILNQSAIPIQGKTKENLATPFYVNVHSVGDHDHCCFYYLATALNPKELSIDKNEVNKAAWFSPEDLKKDDIISNVQDQAEEALKLFAKLN